MTSAQLDQAAAAIAEAICGDSKRVRKGLGVLRRLGFTIDRATLAKAEKMA